MEIFHMRPIAALPHNPGRRLRAEAIYRAAVALAASQMAGPDRLSAENALTRYFGGDGEAAAVLRAAVAPLASADTTALATSALDTLLADLAPTSAAASLFLAAGTRIDTASRTVSLPLVDTGATAGWVEELDPIPVTTSDLGAVSIEPRKLGAVEVEGARPLVWDHDTRTATLTIRVEARNGGPHPREICRDPRA